MHFTGTISAKLDAKGRVFLPSDFRKQLAEFGDKLVLKRDTYQPCLVVYPQRVWCAEVEELRGRINRWNPHEAMLFRQFMADVEQIILDGNGRFLIPRRYMQVCGLTHEVQFVGVDDRIELWSAEKREECFLAPAQFAEAMEALSVRMQPSSDGAAQ